MPDLLYMNLAHPYIESTAILLDAVKGLEVVSIRKLNENIAP